MKIKAGLSQADLFGAACSVTTLLPMLQLDEAMQTDWDIPDGKNRPNFLHDYSRWHNKPAVGRRKGESDDDFTNRKVAKIRQQKLEYQELISEALSRVTGGEPVHLAIFYHNDDTCEGIELAIRNAMLLEEQDELPDNMSMQAYRVQDESLYRHIRYPEEGDKVSRRKGHEKRVQQWCQVIQSHSLPTDSANFGIVELLPDKDNKGRLGVRGAIRAAFEQGNINCQMVLPIYMGDTEDGGRRYLRGGSHQGSEHRVNSAVRDLLVRHSGLSFGEPCEVYNEAGVTEPLDVICFHLTQTNSGLRYALATKIMPSGEVWVRLPQDDRWYRYHQAAHVLGKLFSDAWQDRRSLKWEPKKKRWELDKSLPLYMSPEALNLFIETVLSNLEYPTLAIIDHETWRNRYIWPQLRNVDLARDNNVLNFKPRGSKFQRNLPQFENLRAVIRMKSGVEIPQYVTDTERDFLHPHTMYRNENDLLHYYSIGRQLNIAKTQQKKQHVRASKTSSMGAGIAYKHPQVVEFVPFFVHPNYEALEGQQKLCRVSHALRTSPTYEHANIVLPYPMHLAKALMEDQLCIIAMDD